MTCSDCGAPIAKPRRGPTSSRCLDCRARIRFPSSRTAKQAKNPPTINVLERPKPRHRMRFRLVDLACETCGVAMTIPQNGHHFRTRCLDCASEQTCADCGRSFIRHPQATSQTRCGTCSSRRRYDAELERDKVRARHRNHLRRGATTSTDVSSQYVATILSQSRKCPRCGVWMTSQPAMPNSKEVDHHWPLNAGGTHTRSNLRVICRRCNLTRPKDGRDEDIQLVISD